jgi:hypothetical protein
VGQPSGLGGALRGSCVKGWRSSGWRRVIGERVYNVNAGLKRSVQQDVCSDGKAGHQETVCIERNRGAEDAVDAGVLVVANYQEDVDVWSTNQEGAWVDFVVSCRGRIQIGVDGVLNVRTM